LFLENHSNGRFRNYKRFAFATAGEQPLSSKSIVWTLKGCRYDFLEFIGKIETLAAKPTSGEKAAELQTPAIN